MRLTLAFLVLLAIGYASSAQAQSDPLAAVLQANAASPPQQQQQAGADEPRLSTPDEVPIAEAPRIPPPVADLAHVELRTPVPQVSSAEFEAMVHGPLPILVEFYAPWCHYCKQMAPLFDEASLQMKNQPIKTQLVKVDCMQERALCARFHVGGFPTIKLIRRSEEDSSKLVIFHFEQQRSTLSFLVFCSTMWRTMQQQSQPYPELDPQQAQFMKDVWEAQKATIANTQQQTGETQQQQLQQQQQQNQQPHAPRAEPIPSQPPPKGPRPASYNRPLGGMPEAPSLDALANLGKINLGTQAIKHATEAVARKTAAGAAAGAAPQQGVAAGGAGGSTGSGQFIGWGWLMLLFIVLLISALLLCARFRGMIGGKNSRHHSLQLAKNV